MARKKLFIDWNRAEQAFMAGANGQQVAAMLGISYDTLYKRCRRDHKTELSEYKRQKREQGNTLLHAAQYKQALAGNTSMLIWLGKNRLGQTDKRENVNDNSGKIQIEITYPESDE